MFFGIIEYGQVQAVLSWAEEGEVAGLLRPEDIASCHLINRRTRSVSVLTGQLIVRFPCQRWWWWWS